jgi:hypothetical protein
MKKDPDILEKEQGNKRIENNMYKIYYVPGHL